METIEYTTVGHDDFFEKVEIDSDGNFLVEGGSQDRKAPRSGVLNHESRQLLEELIAHLPESFNNVNGDRSLAAKLVVNTPQGRREFWIRPFAQAPREIGQLVSFIREL